MNPIPEILLVAILHKAGLARIDENTLKEIINDAADNNVIFEQFKQHPQYHHSEVLDETLRLFMLGGMMTREGESVFKLSPRLIGRYGKARFSELVTAKLLRNRCLAETK